MDSNPFAIDAIDEFDSATPGLERLLLHESALEALAVAVFGTRMEQESQDTVRRRSVLLISPQPGSGKTHLLARLKGIDDHLMIPLRFRSEGAVDWESVLLDTLTYVDAVSGSSGEVSLLEERARRVFAELTANLIRAGAIPCPNEDEALRALTEHPVDVFDFATERGDVVKWFCSVFETLVPSFAEEAARCYSIEHGEAVFWLRELYAYCQERAQENAPRESRVQRFLEAEETDLEERGPESIAKEKFTSFGKIVSSQGALTFVADHLDSLYGNLEKGREIACILVDIPRLVPGSAAVLSVNVDLWESIFNGTLPGAIEDRLTGNMVALTGISLEEAERLIDNRLSAAGIPDDVKFRFLPLVGLKELFETDPQRGPTPRRVLRHAKACWEAFADSGYEAEVESGVAAIEEEIDSAGGEERGDDEQADVPVITLKKEDADHSPGESAGKGGVEFVSLTEDPMKNTAFAPLEPLHFENPITLRAHPPVTSPANPAKAPAKPPEPRAREVNAPVAKPPAEPPAPQGFAPQNFDWAAAEADRESVAPAPSKETTKPEPAMESPLAQSPASPAPPVESTRPEPPPLPVSKPEAKPNPEPEATAPPAFAAEFAPDPEPSATAPAVVPEPEPEPVVEETPELSDTVGDLMKEAEEGFSGFRDIFREAMIDDDEKAAMMSTPEVAPEPVENVAPVAEIKEEPAAPAKEEPAASPPPVSSEDSESSDFVIPELTMPEFLNPQDEPVAEIDAEPAPPASTPTPVPVPEPVVEATPEPRDAQAVNGEPESLPAYYNHLRHEALETVSAAEIDLLRFYLVIRAVGELFPVVTQTEFDLPGKPGYRVIGWSYSGHDIVFGFLGVEHADYWQSLMNYAAQSRSGGGAWPEGGREVKVAVLTPDGLPLEVASWLASLNLSAGLRSMVDSVEVDPETVAAVYAAAHLLGEAAAATSAHSAGDVLGFVTRELDYFWRRLTRPVASVGSSAPFGQG